MGFFLNAYKRILKRESLFEAQRVGPVVGVDIGHSHLLVVGAEKKEGGLEISRFRVEPRPPTPEGTSERLKTIFQEEGLNPKGVRTALKSTGVVIRFLTFPQMKRAELASMLQYEVEKYIPFKSNEVILDFEILKENIPQEGDSKTLELLLVAVKDSEVRELLGLFQRAEIEIEVIDIAALAFANLIEFVLPASREACVGFVDMGEESSTFGIALRGKPIFIRNISFGGGDVLKLLKRKLGLEAEAVLEIQRDAERQTEEYKLVVEQAFSGLLRELKLSVGYYLDHISGAEPIQTLLIAGGGFRFFSETEYLARELKVRVERLGILSRVSVGSGIDAAVFKKSEDLLPSALGLCLR